MRHQARQEVPPLVLRRTMRQQITAHAVEDRDNGTGSEISRESTLGFVPLRLWRHQELAPPVFQVVKEFRNKFFNTARGRSVPA